MGGGIVRAKKKTFSPDDLAERDDLLDQLARAADRVRACQVSGCVPPFLFILSMGYIRWGCDCMKLYFRAHGELREWFAGDLEAMERCLEDKHTNLAKGPALHPASSEEIREYRRQVNELMSRGLMGMDVRSQTERIGEK